MTRRDRWSTLLVAAALPVAGLLGLSALAGCGDPVRPTLEQLLLKLGDKDPRVADAAVELLGKEGRADPARVVPRIIALLELEHLRSRLLAARVTPDLAPVKDPAARDAAMLQLGRLVGGRVGTAGFPGVQVRQEADRVDVFVAPPDDLSLTAPMQEHLLVVLRAPGGFALEVEVPPPFSPTPERPWSPWTGSEAEYAEWLDGERARFHAAEQGGPAYVPSRPGFRLRPVRPGPEAGEARAVPVLVPEPPLVALDQSRLACDQGEHPIAGTPALRVFPTPDGRAATEAVLQRVAGLRLWLVMGGEALLPGSVPTPTATLALLPLHGATREEARARGRSFEERMAVPPFPLKVAVDRIARPTVVSLDSPAARALAGVGLQAQPALDALLEKDPAWEPFVARMREALVRTETGARR